MLEIRILKTIQFFHLQDIAPTAFEIYKYLVSRPDDIKEYIDEHFNLSGAVPNHQVAYVSFGAISQALIRLTAEKRLVCMYGFYTLPENTPLAFLRNAGSVFGTLREQRINRYVKLFRYVPFIRAVAIGGSQALGLKTKDSDIDLIIITHSGFLWLARIFTHVVLDSLLVCRHGDRIANRFCLNHYIAGVKTIDTEKNMFRAFQYVRMRPVFGHKVLHDFLHKNNDWIKAFFPNWTYTFQREGDRSGSLPASVLQRFLEKICNNVFGLYIENIMGHWQLNRIRTGEFAVAEASELAFHSNSRKETVLGTYFQNK